MSEKQRFYITEEQWQELAKKIQACSTWAEVKSLMDESWNLLKLQQEQVIAYLGSDNVLLINWGSSQKVTQ